jgi:hypothetical protein
LQLLLAEDEDGDFPIENIPILLACAEEYTAPRKHYYVPRRYRTLDEFSDAQCKHLFKYENKHDIRRLMTAMNIPEDFQRSNGSYVSGEEAFLITLMRFTYPLRWCTHMETFGGSAGFLSETFYLVLNHIYDNFADKVLNDLSRYAALFPKWANAIATKRGAYSGDVALFIDGTIRRMCRPTHNQKAVYSGHKRIHGLKYQAVSAPCGLIVDLYGPVCGRRHDMHLLRVSRILHRMREANGDGRVFRMYGDPAYPIADVILRAFRGVNLTQAQVDLNAEFNAMRTSVEWSFGRVVQYVSYLDYKAAMKLEEAPLALLYKVGVILTNCHLCLYRNGTTVSFFNCDPPTLEAYLGDEPLAP